MKEKLVLSYVSKHLLIKMAIDDLEEKYFFKLAKKAWQTKGADMFERLCFSVSGC